MSIKKRVYDLIGNYPQGLTFSKVIELINYHVSERTIQSHLSQLVKEGRLRANAQRCNSCGSSHYVYTLGKVGYDRSVII